MRIASFAQESQRYVGYGDVIEFIIPSWTNLQPFECECWYKSGENELGPTYGCQLISDQLKPNTPEWTWAYNMIDSARDYLELLSYGWRPEQARSVLPNSVKTEIWINGNLRTWQNIFRLRDHHTASPEMRELMEPLHIKVSGMMPGVFE